MQFNNLPAYQIRRVAESILDMAEDLFARHLEIRVLDWRVLVKLADRPGSIPTEIGRDMLMTPVQTGRSLLKLREFGLVAAVPDPEDGRATRYTMTQAGRTAYEAGMKIVLAVQDFALRDLSAVERVALDGLLGRLMHNTSYTDADIGQLSARLFGGKRNSA
ncbi:winged helix-turn-helix transcriptional regulator [Paraburkholderia sp. Tr-20389]|uniref:MarR family winged helix-turn-helix transcriptional regulator n=1 Tax=Paraburkholderia sp. Tr-20389 TaxID=2703903 RepID=UPI00197EB49E|nr:MarR family winged helix-turn-helix transcriptional regulator [Paraburkholderia sp. Tr-20389]MBN3754329.1 winged helix-turn-helix transcriptional regulator [Paraburkholderia sp. Tr-20389]